MFLLLIFFTFTGSALAIGDLNNEERKKEKVKKQNEMRKIEERLCKEAERSIFERIDAKVRKKIKENLGSQHKE